MHQAGDSIGHMPAYGAAHLVMLALLLLAALLVVRWARRAEGARVDRALRTAGWALLAGAVL